jgi:hypothetical protein
MAGRSAQTRYSYSRSSALDFRPHRRLHSVSIADQIKIESIPAQFAM